MFAYCRHDRLRQPTEDIDHFIKQTLLALDSDGTAVVRWASHFPTSAGDRERGMLNAKIGSRRIFSLILYTHNGIGCESLFVLPATFARGGSAFSSMARSQAPQRPPSERALWTLPAI
jgi:hypothetical protein